jgi:hypothetical protein
MAKCSSVSFPLTSKPRTSALICRACRRHPLPSARPHARVGCRCLLLSKPASRHSSAPSGSRTLSKAGGVFRARVRRATFDGLAEIRQPKKRIYNRSRPLDLTFGCIGCCNPGISAADEVDPRGARMTSFRLIAVGLLALAQAQAGLSRERGHRGTAL